MEFIKMMITAEPVQAVDWTSSRCAVRGLEFRGTAAGRLRLETWAARLRGWGGYLQDRQGRRAGEVF